MVLCVLTKKVRTMAQITTKEYIAARQIKKRTETVFPGINPEVQSPFVLQAKRVKNGE